MNKLFLIGMPATGKTYWGRKISEAYGLPFVDLDSYIEKKEKSTISELFRLHTEAGFREIEKAALAELMQDTGNGIIACGGGTPFFFNNMQLMHDAGCVIYLSTEISTLTARLLGESGKRPLLNGSKDIRAELEKILSERKAVYEQAHYILPEDNLSIATFAQIINTCTGRH